MIYIDIELEGQHKNEQTRQESQNMMFDLGMLIDLVYDKAKYNQSEELTYEKIERDTAEGPALDCGTVACSDYSIEKIDLYGDNPMFTYKDDQGVIFIQLHYITASTVKLGDSEAIYARDVTQNKEALEYFKTVSEKMKKALESKLEENKEEKFATKALQ